MPSKYLFEQDEANFPLQVPYSQHFTLFVNDLIFFFNDVRAE